VELVKLFRWFGLATLLALLPGVAFAQHSDRLIEGQWRSVVFDTRADGSVAAPAGDATAPAFDDENWARVSVPHNWQGYSYDRQVRNGSRHGTAWYRKTLMIAPPAEGEHVFLMFEGVNSYATIWLNGVEVGRHGGGLTSFEVDVTRAVWAGENLLTVKVDNPKGITDLPWAPGDDQPENGFSEGSQPFGIFRPVHVVRTGDVRVRPFGVYAWGDPGAIDATHAMLHTRTEIANLSDRARAVTIVTRLIDPDGRVVAEARGGQRIAAGAEATLDRMLPTIEHPRLWSPDTPTLYTLVAEIREGGRVLDTLSTPYGIRTVRIVQDDEGHRRLLVNGEPFTVRGTAEYEHLLGGSHAFSPEQIAARIEQVEAAGFNAFRDGHYPHNLRYGERIARDGLLWWPQFSAHNWFDNPAYRANFLALLADWVRERRNNPAVFLWGLQNESQLPKAFAEQATALIRRLDPTASIQRLVVTCNGGEGTDWNVPQNWSGTYGGDPDKYAEELRKQGLVGEYGAWRSLGLHDEPPFSDAYSEERMATLEHKKARLADSVADETVGQFQWLLATHENPGRPMREDGTQIWDGIRPLDHVGPANNKGLMTLWGEPVDAYYMFRARQVPASVAPVVYIVSHTWADRWTAPGIKSHIEVYSNCDEVELFNDARGTLSLGRKRRNAEQRFIWNDVSVRYNVLSAACLIGGKVAARDLVTLDNLPRPSDAVALVRDPVPIVRGEAGWHYLYRVNAGGPAVTDADGQAWQADRHLGDGAAWGWTSWADAYPALDPRLGSRGKVYDPIQGTRDQALFQTYRYGRDQLRYVFPVPPGQYRIELYFAEPWYGRTGIDSRGWRLFDVAVNGETKLRDLDLFAAAGFEHAVKKVIKAEPVDGTLVLTFPRVAAGQAVVSAIAIAAREEKDAAVAAGAPGTDLIVEASAGQPRTYLDNGDRAFTDGGHWTHVPYALLDSDWIRPVSPAETGTATIRVRVDSDLYLALPERAAPPAGWQRTDHIAQIIDGTEAIRYRFVKRLARAGTTVRIPASAPLILQRTLPSPYTPGAFSFGRDEGLREVEGAKVEREGVTVATERQGYGGSGYVVAAPGLARLTWDVTTGAAGRHQFRLRYAIEGETPRSAVLTITDSSGIEVARLPVSFVPGRGWQEVSVRTPDAINAGSYGVRLAIASGLSLEIDSIRFE
jgi:beta-galactosidase